MQATRPSVANAVLRNNTRHHLLLFQSTTVSLSSLSTLSPSPIPHRLQTQEHDEKEEEMQQSITNTTYWTRKIHTLCFEHRDADEALRLIDRLCLRGYRLDSLNLSSVIHALCHDARFAEAHRRCLLFLASGCVPDERTCNVLIARLLYSKSPVSTLHLVHSLIRVKTQFVPSLVNYNRLIDQLCSISRVREAHMLLFDLKSRGHLPNVVTYTTLINGYCRIRDVDAAYKVFDEMRGFGVLPNSLTFSTLIDGVLRKRDVESGKNLISQLLERIKITDDLSSNAAFANLIDSLCTQGYVNQVFDIAENLLNKKSYSDEFCYGQMIDSLCKVGRFHGASRIVYIMRKKGFKPSLTSYNSIVHGLSVNGGGCARAYQLLEEGIEFGYLPSEFTYKVLVESLCRESDLNKARHVLKFMLKKEAIEKTRIHNIYIRAVCLMNSPTDLLNALVDMLQSECQPDVITFNTVVNGLCKNGKVDEALQVMNDMVNGKICDPDAVTFTTIISGLLKAGRIEESLDLLIRVMAERGFSPGVVTYNAVLRGLFNLRQTEKAMEVFDRMISNGVNADSITYAVIINGLCESGQVDTAKRVWDDIIWPSKIHDNFVYAGILKGLCMSSNLNEACGFLYELVDCGINPNIVCYNIVIDSACKLGMKKEAYEIVGEMRKNGVNPDAVTWRILDKLHVNLSNCIETN